MNSECSLKLELTLIILTITYDVGAIPRIDPLVDTNIGLIKGQQALDGDYSLFLGIPYAKVNETNPFGLSIPMSKFDETFEAVNDYAMCPQLNDIDNEINGTLDCLKLNVYVPKSASSNNLVPVLVWFYGGSFYRGFANTSMYGPQFLVRHDVILVTVNYRVGPYGFMCLGTPEIPGNQGLKDQLTALRWINNNIRAFGGDSNKVTLFGVSAGGRSVDFHLVSEQEKLFDNIIMQSGNSICPPVIGEVDTRPPLMMAAKLGLETDDISEALVFLSKADPVSIIAASLDIDYTFRPCVEKDLDNIEKFVSDYTINKVTPKVKTTSIMVGYNYNERILPYLNLDNDEIKNINVFENLIKNYFDFEEEHLHRILQLIKQFYIGDEEISEDTIQNIVDFDSDFTYLHPTHRRTYQNILNGVQTGSIYHYLFSYTGQRNLSFKRYNVTVGAAHTDELGYLFDMQVYFRNSPSKEDQLIIDQMTTLWTNFAKFGDPTPTVSDLLPVKWKPITEKEFFYYMIDSDTKLYKRPFHKRMAFWDLFFKYNEHYQKGFKNNTSELNQQI